MDEPNEVEPSLDQLSQAFAEAMGRKLPSTEATSDAEEAEASSNVSEQVATSNVAAPALEVCPISPKSILEAILFVGDPNNEPISAQKVAKLLRGVDVEEVEELVETLNAEYEQQSMPFSIQAAGDGYQLELRGELEHVQERFYGKVRHAKLSQLAVDVLAVVAYNQPVTREEVDKLLNQSQPTARILNQLVRRDLLARQTTGEKPKRKEYVTTDRFLELFQLSDIRDLPRSEDPQ